MKTNKILFTLALIVMAITHINAQNLTDMIADWERAKAYTQEYMEAMPDDKFDFKATPEVRSFAQQMLHITDANYGFMAAIASTESPVAFGESEKTEDTSKAHVIELVNAGYDYVIDGLKNLSDDQLAESVNLFGQFEMTKAKALDKMFEHQTHHRGQATIYLRLAGVKPPNEKLF